MSSIRAMEQYELIVLVFVVVLGCSTTDYEDEDDDDFQAFGAVQRRQVQ